MKEGWKCPVCGMGNAPWIAHCPCGGNPDYTKRSASTINPYEQYDYTAVHDLESEEKQG